MKRLYRITASVCAAGLLFFPLVSSGEAAAPQKIRFGYIQSEDYNQFSYQLYGIYDGLSQLGYSETCDDALDGEENAQLVWSGICRDCSSESAVFAEDACYTLDKLTDSEKNTLLSREDIDCYIVMGTAAGVWLTQSELSADYMVFASADPISAGICVDENTCVKSNGYAHIDKNRFLRQITAAYNYIGFGDIGVVYENSEAAYSYSGMAQLERLSDELGFTIHRVYVDEPESSADRARYYSELSAAYKTLLPDIDALYITTASIEDDMLPSLLEDVHKAGIVTIAQSSESQVENGAMLHVTINSPDDEGIFGAYQLDSYINGTPTNELEQVFECTPKIILNYDTVRTVGMDISYKKLLVADKIYCTGAAYE